MQPKQIQFSALLKESTGLIYSILRKYCRDEAFIDDLYQDVAISAWNAYDTFSRNVKFCSWIGKIARNKAISWMRSFNGKMKKVSCDNIMYKIHEPYEEPPALKIPRSAIDSLTIIEKNTLHHVLAGLSYKEISVITGETPNRIAVRMHRIRKSLTRSFSK